MDTLAMGIDRAVHLEDRAFAGSDALRHRPRTRPVAGRGNRSI